MFKDYKSLIFVAAGVVGGFLAARTLKAQAEGKVEFDPHNEAAVDAADAEAKAGE